MKKDGFPEPSDYICDICNKQCGDNDSFYLSDQNLKIKGARHRKCQNSLPYTISAIGGQK